MGTPVKTAVVGATGYAGFELVRILQRHPRLKPPLLMRRENGARAPEKLEEIFPQASGNGSHPLDAFSWSRLKDQDVSVLFFATPHEVSREMVPEAISRGFKVIDLSGAWRLRQPAHRQVYGFEDRDPAAAEALDKKAVYGIAELHAEEIAQAELVANPGCYATSIILALAPLRRSGLIDCSRGVVCDSKSGVSGAGKQPTSNTHFVEVADNLSAYSLFGHRHTGEMLEQLDLSPAELIFTPHLLPIPRGIFSTIYVRLSGKVAASEIEQSYRALYAGKPWIRIFGEKLPQIQYSARTNFCDIGFALSPDGERLVIVSCLDNLLKGAAGQAVQNLNLRFGWDQREGLN